MLRFVFTPRWIGLLVVVLVLGLGCVRLSQWQFDRYQERKESNTLVRGNLAAAPTPLSRLLSTSAAPSRDVEWRTVTVSGHYAGDDQIAVLYRTRNGSPGVDVVTPFVTDAGPAVLVDRGWVPSSANGNQTQQLPPPAGGRVTLSGRIRIGSEGSSSQVTPSQGSVRAISPEAIDKTLAYPLYDGFLELMTERPASPHPPTKAGVPDLGGGPSFFYGFQWLFFGLLFFGFWCYFAWAEYRAQVSGGTGERGLTSRRQQGPRDTAEADDSQRVVTAPD